MTLAYHPFANLLPLVEGPDFEELVVDIRDKGLRDEIVVIIDDAGNNLILDGRNRYRACLAAGIEPRIGVFHPDEQGDPLAYVISRNVKRRHLNEAQRAMAAAKIANMPAHRPSATDKCASLHTSQATAAGLLRVSKRSVASAKAVQDHGEPDLVRAVDQGKMGIAAAAAAATLPAEQQRRIAERALAGDADSARTVLKRSLRETREAELGRRQHAGNLELPAKQYGVILADPEWQFKVWSERGMDRAADNHYPTTPTAEIAARLLASIAADDCVLFQWATIPMLPDSLAVMAAAGFTYKSHLVWAKNAVGTGYWFREQHELLLVGTRGDIPAPAMGSQRPSVFHAARREHSEKPAGIYDMIEALYPNIPKIELNARQMRFGWDGWGAEAEKRLVEAMAPEEPAIEATPVPAVVPPVAPPLDQQSGAVPCVSHDAEGRLVYDRAPPRIVPPAPVEATAEPVLVDALTDALAGAAGLTREQFLEREAEAANEEQEAQASKVAAPPAPDDGGIPVEDDGGVPMFLRRRKP